MSKTTWLIIGSVALLLVLGIVGSLVMPYGWGRGYGRGMMGPGMMGGFGFFPFMGGIATLVFWALVIGGGIWLFRSIARGAGTTTPHTPPLETPLDILKRRYAKGEISKEQFEEMKHALGV